MYQLIKEVHSLSAYIVLVVLLSVERPPPKLICSYFCPYSAAIRLIALCAYAAFSIVARGQDGDENQSVASFAFRTPIGDDYCGSAYYYWLVKTQKARDTSC